MRLPLGKSSCVLLWKCTLTLRSPSAHQEELNPLLDTSTAEKSIWLAASPLLIIWGACFGKARLQLFLGILSSLSPHSASGATTKVGKLNGDNFYIQYPHQ